LSDQKKFEKQYLAHKILRYENEVDVDKDSGSNKYIVRVCYEAEKGERYLYTFTMLHGEQNGTYRLDLIPEGAKCEEKMH